MTWRDDPKHPFAGIAEKLKRADENIGNLKSEIDLFIESGEYPVIAKVNSEMWKKAMAYHREKPIPLRFSVLAGEVVHHLRSCLDHIVWHFSDDTSRRIAQNAIEFPILEFEPTKKNEIERYERKIQGITKANVLSLIKDMQPYNAGADTAHHALLIVHNMDRFDKHRELVIINSNVEVNFPPGLEAIQRKADLFNQGKLPQAEHLNLSHALVDYGKAAPSVGFRNFGQWGAYSVIKGLAQLQIIVDNVVAEFASEV